MMLVLVQHGLTPIELGAMSTLPLVGDRVVFEVPGLREGDEPMRRHITVASRSFEQKLRPVNLALSTLDPIIAQVPEWVCVLKAKAAEE